MTGRELLGAADVTDDQLATMVADLLGEESVGLVDVRVEPVDYDLPAITTAGRWWVSGHAATSNGDAPFRILLCHFPRALDYVDEGRWHLILSGHLHGGQIVLPYGFGRLLLAHPSARYRQGVYRRGSTTMHVSAGLGTTFVPLRFFARPEATELVLRSS